MAFNVNEGGDDAPMSDINVTPLVDVMLVLLIVFMITMPVSTHSIQITLPTTNESKAQQFKEDKKPINLQVDAAGKYVLGAESTTPVDLVEVKAKLEELAKTDPDAVLAIDADKNTPYENVVKVLEAAKDAGISKVGFRLEQTKQ